MRQRYYILENGVIKATDDLLEWGRWFENTDNRVIARDEINGVLVSTVFLGIDHNFTGEGPPVLFESMIFEGEFSEEQRRYRNMEEALEGHAALVHLVKTRGIEIHEKKDPPPQPKHKRKLRIESREV